MYSSMFGKYIHLSTYVAQQWNRLYLVETNEGGDPNVLLFEEGDTFLSCVNGVNHNVVQSTTAGRNGHVVLLIYGSKVSLQAKNIVLYNTELGLTVFHYRHLIYVYR